MPRTMPVMTNYTREDREVVCLWLATHLPAARRAARNVTVEQAAAGVEANPRTGAEAVPPITGVVARTLRRIESREKGYAPQADKIEPILIWVARYLGRGPEDCRAERCEFCAPRERKPRA